MSSRRFPRLGLVAVLWLALAGLPAPAPTPLPPSGISKVDPLVLSQTANGGQSDFLVELADQADLSGAVNLLSKIEKGRFVYHTLLAKAQSTQGPLIAWLRAQHVAYQPFYIVNMIWVKAGAGVVQALAARADVVHVDANPRVKGVEVRSAVVQAPAPAGIEPNVTYVHADQLWALGFKGQGIVIGSGDTGIQWDHPALQPHYRGWNGSVADHNENWHDSIHDSSGNPCGNDAPAPCDDFGHGTHTIGSAVGDDGGDNQIGVAPGAKWIGCRNMDQGVGTPARYIECFQFFLAPYPISGTTADGNPDLAPDVTTNSWTCPTSEGCTGDGNELLAAVQAQQAAGILTVVAAGNDGPSCNTVHEPPAIYGPVYSVGALDTGTDNIASFSSRGPVTLDGSNRRKPDITAPGNQVRSSYPPNTYTYLQGTSMATPAVAGAAALLWSAVPGLRGQVTLTEQILNDSAVHLVSTDCGSSGWPNNTFGYGRLDVKAAYDLANLPVGVLSGTVSSSAGGANLVDVHVTATRELLTYTTTTDLAGDYNMSVITGTYTLLASAFGFLPATIQNIVVSSGITTTVPISLTPAILNFWPVFAR